MIGLAIFGWLCLLVLTLWATASWGALAWASYAFQRTDSLFFIMFVVMVILWFFCLTTAPFSITWRGL